METDKVPVVDKKLLEWIRAIRRTLHQHPELSYQEHRTSAFIQEKLAELGVVYRNGWGGTGVIASLGSALVEERDDDLRVHVGTLSGVARGLPAYLSDPDGDARPIAHVLTHGTDDDEIGQAGHRQPSRRGCEGSIWSPSTRRRRARWRAPEIEL